MNINTARAKLEQMRTEMTGDPAAQDAIRWLLHRLQQAESSLSAARAAAERLVTEAKLFQRREETDLTSMESHR